MLAIVADNGTPLAGDARGTAGSRGAASGCAVADQIDGETDRCEHARTRQVSGSRPSLASALWARPPSRPSSPDPKAFRSGRDFAAWIGIVPRQDSTGGKQKLGPISNRATNTSGAFLLSEPILSCGVRASSQRNIPGSLSFSLGDRSRSSRSRWPTRWRGSPGRCWPGVGPTGRPNSWQPNKELGNGRMRLRPCVHELQG